MNALIYYKIKKMIKSKGLLIGLLIAALVFMGCSQNDEGIGDDQNIELHMNTQARPGGSPGTCLIYVLFDGSATFMDVLHFSNRYGSQWFSVIESGPVPINSLDAEFLVSWFVPCHELPPPIKTEGTRVIDARKKSQLSDEDDDPGVLGGESIIENGPMYIYID